MTLHEIPLERRTLHGHFSRDLEPILTIASGDTVACSCLDSGWNVEPGRKFEPRAEGLDDGHALVGPIAIDGAREGQVLEIRIDRVRVGTWGATFGGGWSTPLNERLGVVDVEGSMLRWTLDADAAVGRDQHGHEVDLYPFPGVLGMPPPDHGVHSTVPPRVWGGNLDCKELVEGTTLFLPIPVDGGLFSAGDGHARQGDGEISQTAIECPLERLELTLTVRDDLTLETPIARVHDAWLTLAVDEDLDEAATVAADAMLTLMEREHGLRREDALALASVVVDLRLTQMVNGVRGVHAVLPDNALR